MTPIRSALINILRHGHEPATSQELLAALARRGLRANKTTVYRQLEALERYGIVQRVNFADRSKRFELVGEGEHHHHLVCWHCQRVADVSFPTDLKHQEQLIWKQNKFKVLQHSLEFFGVCRRCQNKTR